jgi:hypothetical protein
VTAPEPVAWREKGGALSEKMGDDINDYWCK